MKKKGTAGFTLVELIVVIAIMGILAGVGTVGYSGYVKSAQKKADQTLVGNIIRAIEVGVNSTMFVPEDSVSVAATSYPIGFITLTTEKGDVLGSNSKLAKAEGACKLETIKIAYPKENKVKQTCSNADGNGVTMPIYELVDEMVLCCLEHSEFVKEEAINERAYPISYKHTCTIENNCLTGNEDKCTSATTKDAWEKADTLKVSLAPDDETKLVLDKADLYGRSASDFSKCELAYKTQHGSFVSKSDTDADGDGKVDALVSADNALTQALEAAFGDLSKLTLQYDGWGKDSEDAVDYATFYTYAPNIFEDVKEQAGTLIWATQPDQAWINDLAIKTFGYDLTSFLTEGGYDDTADLMTSFATFVSSKMTAEEWAGYWAAAADDPSDEYTFHLDDADKGAKNDYIWAARMAYNSSFASYCDANGFNYTDKNGKSYTELIANYGDKELGVLSIPSVVNTAAFDMTGEGSLKQRFADAGDTDGKIFDAYDKLYEKYKVSEACKKNGAVFHSTMQTIDQTSDVAHAQGDENAYFNYYKNYLDQMANMYNEAEDRAEGGIMIIVSVNAGQIEYVVTPSNAYPSNS